MRMTQLKEKVTREHCLNCNRMHNRFFREEYGDMTGQFCRKCREEYLKENPEEDITIYEFYKVNDGEESE